MSLIKSISGFRGTIGGTPNDNLTPLDAVKFAASYAKWIKSTTDNKKVVVGRDGRISGEMIQNIVVSTLVAMGIDVINLDLSTTPTVEMAVVFEEAAGGIILTASHNPKEWNALKLLNAKGEFISAEDGRKILSYAASEDFTFETVDKLGKVTNGSDALEKHIQAIINYPLVDVPAISAKKFKVVIDAINSTGAFAVPALLEKLGVEPQNIIVLNKEVTGNFAHNPEPLAEHLLELTSEVVRQKADFGIAVDPDVDRLLFVNEDGSLFGEEYTLVAVADYILSKRKGNTVSNLSSTRALRDITEKHGGNYFASAVGEVNVVNKMKEKQAVIGGEGNGGVIVPDFHYGRDALIGIALFLSYLAQKGFTATQLRNTYPNYFMSKNKIVLDKDTDVQSIFAKIKEKYSQEKINTEDGLKIEFETGWVHLRTSNTEPIIRIYSESTSIALAENIAKKIITDIKEVM